MMEIIMKIKQIFILVALMMALLLPCSLSAQWGKSDNFFNDFDDSPYGDRSRTTIYLNGDGGSGGLSVKPLGIENPTPVGNGLLVMVMFGTGYALLKRKKEEK